MANWDIERDYHNCSTSKQSGELHRGDQVGITRYVFETLYQVITRLPVEISTDTDVIVTGDFGHVVDVVGHLSKCSHWRFTVGLFKLISGRFPFRFGGQVFGDRAISFCRRHRHAGVEYPYRMRLVQKYRGLPHHRQSRHE